MYISCPQLWDTTEDRDVSVHLLTACTDDVHTLFVAGQDSCVRGWYKLHAAVDSETGHILAYVVTEPYCNDSPVFERLIGTVLDAGHEVTRVLADAAYDNKNHWNAIKERGINFIANIHSRLDPKRRNSSSRKFKGCSVRRIFEVGREKWKEEVGYGERWRIEATFGDLKRRFGDKLRARARERVADMISFLVQLFNRFKSARISI